MFEKNLDFEDYKKRKGISQTHLKQIKTCPLLYKYKTIDGNNEPTDAMKLGSAFHDYLLEPKVFQKKYMVTEKIPKRGKKWDELKESTDKEILWTEQVDDFENMASSIMGSDYGSLFDNTENEMSMFWKTKILNQEVDCKGRIDAIYSGINKETKEKKILLIDIKTTANADEKHFNKQSFDLGYDLQAAYYMDGYHAVTGVMPEMFIFIAIELKGPYLTRPYHIRYDSSEYTIAKRNYLDALEIYVECKKNDIFKGYEGSRRLIRPSYM